MFLVQIKLYVGPSRKAGDADAEQQSTESQNEGSAEAAQLYSYCSRG